MNKISTNRQKKENIVAKLSDKVSRAKGLVFANYQGLTHKHIEELKRKVKAANAELVVTKNTLLKLALEQSQNSIRQLTDKSQKSEGPTATLFLYADPIEPLRQLVKTIKELNLGSIKSGIIEGQSLDSEQIIKLAALPSRDVLIAQLLFQMKAPVFRLHRALGWNMQKLVMMLKEIENKRQAS